MFGIKRKLQSFLAQGGRLVSRRNIHNLMRFFRADEYGHQANIATADLGYGWFHYGMIRQLKPSKILCVGSRHGYIPAVLAQACKDNGFGHVDFVDAGYGEGDAAAWTGVGYWRTKAGQDAFYNFGLSRFITPLVMTTEEFVRTYSRLAYDYIYIDGDHSYEGVKKDYELLFPLLHENGFMVFHDISVKENLPEGEYGVWRLWKKIAGKNAITFDFVGSGLGILQKRSSKSGRSK